MQHLFQLRIKRSHPAAAEYISQFPGDKSAQIARFTSLVAGSFAAVLAVASLVDPDLVVGFEVSAKRTVLFYLGIFGSILAISRSLIPEENAVLDPESSLRHVIEHTHYCPRNWKARMATDQVKREFSNLYQLKIVVFLQELIGVFITPFVLWFILPQFSEKIVDFFRESTVHIDGIGHVCSFAVFDFKKPETMKINKSRNSFHVANDGKMMKSYINFLESYSPSGPSGQYGMLSRRKGQVLVPRMHSTSSDDVIPLTHEIEGSMSFSQNKQKPYMDDLATRGTKFSSLRKTSSRGIYDPLLEEDAEDTWGDDDNMLFARSHQADEHGSHASEDEVIDNSPGVIGLLNQFYQNTG